MFANATRGASILLEHIDFRLFRSLLDVGGNSGGYAIPIARAAPTIEVTILDLPAVQELAQAHVAEAGLTPRVTFRPGSFFEPIPGAFEAVLLSSILHDWEDADCARILQNCRAALRPGGTIIVTEPMLAEDFSGPDHPAASGLTMALLGGRNRTRRELSEMLAEAGFTDIWASELLPQNSIVTAKRIP
jgi:2-polyprenyl-3-methyl-5-hydroxy-6-metoxy-1,4-benzoquinol methylase